MELFVLLLVIGLSTSDDLHRTYLPSTEISDVLKVPLEHPKETSIFQAGNIDKDNYIVENQELDLTIEDCCNTNSDVKVETPDDKDFSHFTTEKLYDQPVTFLGVDFETTVTPFSPEMGYYYGTPQNALKIVLSNTNMNTDTRDTPEMIGTNYFGNKYFGNTGNLPIAIPEGITKNYQPKAFRMYGGNPIIIKAYSRSQEHMASQQFEDINENQHNFSANNQLSTVKEHNTTEDLFTSDQDLGNKLGNTKYPDKNPDKTIVMQNYIRKSQVSKHLSKRPESPQTASDINAVILNYENVITPVGYKNNFDTSNGIHKDESATTLDGVRAQGLYSYTGDDGKLYSVIYSADKNGFQPKGDHLPTPPPVPKAIQKVIEQARRDKEAGIIHDGSYDEERYGYMKYQGPVYRYLHTMQEKFKTKKTNRIIRPKKIKRPIAIEKNCKNNKTDNLYGNKILQRYFQRPIDNLNGQFGIKNVLSDDKNDGVIKKPKEKQINKLSPLTSIQKPQDNFKPRLNRNKSKFKTLNRRLKGYNIGQINNTANRNLNRNPITAKSNFVNNRRLEITTITQDGYYYVPPKNIFVEGKIQDKPIPDVHSITAPSNLDTELVPLLGYYNIDQRNNDHQLTEKSSQTTSYFTTTEETIQQQVYDSNFKNTNSDIEDVIKNDETTTEIPMNIITDNLTMGYNESFFKQDDTIIPENDFSSTEDSLRIKYQSTTAIPSQINRDQPFSKKFKTTDPSTEFDDSPLNTVYRTTYEGYFRSTPEVKFYLEDFPSSIPSDEINTKLTSSLKVNGFGRSIQDKSTNSPNDSDNTFDGEDIAPLDNNSTSTDSDRSDGKTGNYNENRNKSNDGIILEDFSGPKQSQSYDPVTGYYY